MRDLHKQGRTHAPSRTLSESRGGHMQLKGSCHCGAVKFRLQSDSPFPSCTAKSRESACRAVS